MGSSVNIKRLIFLGTSRSSTRLVTRNLLQIEAESISSSKSLRIERRYSRTLCHLKSSIVASVECRSSQELVADRSIRSSSTPAFSVSIIALCSCAIPLSSISLCHQSDGSRVVTVASAVSNDRRHHRHGGSGSQQCRILHVPAHSVEVPFPSYSLVLQEDRSWSRNAIHTGRIATADVSSEDLGPSNLSSARTAPSGLHRYSQ